MAGWWGCLCGSHSGWLCKAHQPHGNRPSSYSLGLHRYSGPQRNPFVGSSDDRPAVSPLKTLTTRLLGPCCYSRLRAVPHLMLVLGDEGHCLALPDLGRSSTRPSTDGSPRPHLGPSQAHLMWEQRICPARLRSVCSGWGSFYSFRPQTCKPN